MSKKLYDENGNVVKGAKVKKPFYKRWWFILLVVLVIGGALVSGDEDTTSEEVTAEETNTEVVADEDADEEATEEEVEEEPEVEEVEEEETPEKESEHGKRSNPVPVGEWASIEESLYDDEENFLDAVLNLRITDVVRGEEAFEILKNENQFNEEAPEGHEWVIISLEAKLVEGSEDAPFTVVPWFSIIDSTGSEVSQDDWGTLDGDEYGYVDLFEGGETSGRYVFYTLEGDDTLLSYEQFFEGSIYFSLK